MLVLFGCFLLLLASKKYCVNTKSNDFVMEKIQQYLKINDIRPDYHRLLAPYERPSHKKIVMNLKEIELHYQKEFGIFIPAPNPPTRGGVEEIEDDSVVQLENQRVECWEVEF